MSGPVRAAIAQIPAWQLAVFSAPALAIAAVGPPIGVFLPAFYAQDIGLGVAVVGIAFMGMRLLNALTIPFIGAAMDATHGRFGRFRPWLTLGALLLCTSVIALFTAERGVGPLYLCGWLGLLYVANSICVQSHAAWAASLSDDYAGRSRVYGWWQTFNVIGTIIVLTIPLLYFNDVKGYAAPLRAMGWSIIVMFVPSMLFALLLVGEPPARKAKHRLSIRSQLSALRRPALRRILVVCILLEAINNIRGPMTLFFFLSIKRLSTVEVSWLLMAQLLGALAGAAAWGMMSGRIGKHTALNVSSALFAGSLIALFIVPEAIFWPSALVIFLAGAFSAAGPSLVRAMMADASDEEHLETGVQRAGTLQSLIGFANNIGAALGIGFALVSLGVLGFRGSMTDALGPMARWGLPLLYIIAPAALALLIVWVLRGYHLTAERHAEVREQLFARDNPLPDVGPRQHPKG